MFAEQTLLAAAIGVLSLLFLAGFLFGRAWVRAAQIIIMLVAMPLLASYASGGEGAYSAAGCGCMGDGDDVTWPSTVGDYQAAMPVEEAKAEDAEGATVDVHGSSVVGSVKTARKSTKAETDDFSTYAGGGGCTRQQQ